MLEPDINAALIECVKACGGSKVVGAALWPEKAPDSAQRLLLACLNENRQERLTPDQVVLVGRMARNRGCHALMNFLAAELGYSRPQPVSAQDAAHELTLQIAALADRQAVMLAELRSLAGRHG